jgi:hypothetical protein
MHGSNNHRHADNQPVSKEQARNPARTERGPGRKIRIAFAESPCARAVPPVHRNDCFWGRRPGCNPPSVLSSICLIGEPAPPAEDHRRLLPLSHRRRDPFHPQSNPSINAPRERAYHRHLELARSRFCAPAQALTWHLLRSQRSPPCGWSFLKTTINGPVTAHRLAAYPNKDRKKCRAEGFST